MILEKLGFKLDRRATKKSNRNIIYKKITKYDGRFLEIEEEKCILIFNKNSKRVFMNRIITQAGKEHYEPFCADIELLNAIIEIIENM